MVHDDPIGRVHDDPIGRVHDDPISRKIVGRARKFDKTQRLPGGAGHPHGVMTFRGPEIRLADQTTAEASIAQQNVTPSRLPLRVVVADSSYIMRGFLADALSSATQVELVAVCCNGSELESAIATWRPDVVLTDVRISTSAGDEGLRIAGRLRETNPDAGVLVLSEHAEPACAVALLAGGSRGRAYLLKRRIRNRRELIRAIEAVARGDSVIDRMIVDLLMEDQTRAVRSRLSELTPRERELLASIATGQNNAAIADSLFLTTPAVAKQVDSILAKLKLTEDEDVSDRARTILVFLAGEQSKGDGNG